MSIGAAPSAAWPDPDVRAARRSSILAATVEVIAARGARESTVALVAEHAGVSRASFYEHFADLAEATIAVLDDSLQQVMERALRALDQRERPAAQAPAPWWERLRDALAEVLWLFDEQQDLARVCMVEALAAGPAVRAHMEVALACFRTAVVERLEGEVSHVSPLASEGALGAVTSVVRARLLAPAHERKPLIELLGPLVGLIAGSFMDDERLRREIEQGERRASEMARGGCCEGERRFAGVDVPPALLDPRAHRLRRCLLVVAARPGASNQEVGEAIGVLHRGQLTKLLGRLHVLGLLDKRSGAPGHPNAWSATHAGDRAAAALARAPARDSDGVGPAHELRSEGSRGGAHADARPPRNAARGPGDPASCGGARTLRLV